MARGRARSSALEAVRRQRDRGAGLRATCSEARRLRTYLTAPTLDASAYPPAGQAFFERFRARYGAEPDPYAINGYEAMSVILDSIDRASMPASRAAVVDAFFATRDRQSVIGQYGIDHFGDTTLGTYGAYRLDAGRRIVWDRVLDISG